MKLYLIYLSGFVTNIYVQANSKLEVAEELKKKGWESNRYTIWEVIHLQLEEIPTSQTLLNSMK
jgi:hypothetical protein